MPSGFPGPSLTMPQTSLFLLPLPPGDMLHWALAQIPQSPLTPAEPSACGSMHKY